MRTLDQITVPDGRTLASVLSAHAAWLDSEKSGERANLRDADLRDADLSCAILSDANLLDADLRGADLRCANLRDAIGLPEIAVPGLAAAVLAQIEAHPETHDQAVWHSPCGTRHCAAGWAIQLGGPAVREAEKIYGTANAAWLALGRPSATMFGPSDDPLPWLRTLASASASA